MPISIQDFNTGFIVEISTISVPHTDETGTIPAAIGLQLLLKLFIFINKSLY